MIDSPINQSLNQSLQFVHATFLFFQEKKDVKGAAVKEEKEEGHSDQQGKIAFFCGNPMVEIIKGIIHIYKNK